MAAEVVEGRCARCCRKRSSKHAAAAATPLSGALGRVQEAGCPNMMIPHAATLRLEGCPVLPRDGFHKGQQSGRPTILGQGLDVLPVRGVDEQISGLDIGCS